MTKVKRDEDSIMIVRTISRFTAAALLSLTSGIAIGAQGPIYRCAQADGTLLYADNPCDGGTLVDVHPGRADPDAKERLARAQVELNRAAADRKANEQAAAARAQDRVPRGQPTCASARLARSDGLSGLRTRPAARASG